MTVAKTNVIATAFGITIEKAVLETKAIASAPRSSGRGGAQYGATARSKTQSRGLSLVSLFIHHACQLPVRSPCLLLKPKYSTYYQSLG